MFEWLRGKPSCPVDDETKDWIESRFDWLTNEFGLERMTRAQTIVPTEEFLPLSYDNSIEGLEDLMRRVGTYIGVNSTLLKLSFYEDERPFISDTVRESSDGERESLDDSEATEIWLEVNSLEDPGHVVGCLARELAYVVLSRNARLGRSEPDYEPTAELMTVYSGLGIFPANSVILETNWSEGQWSGWTVGKSGLLSMDMYGYAMSLYTLARNEPEPAWAVHLRPDVAAALKRGVRYIQTTSDCSFAPARRCR
ncbi:MAG: hypothetical protein AAFN77_02055 [Planctomycetota bacterium]